MKKNGISISYRQVLQRLRSMLGRFAASTEGRRAKLLFVTLLALMLSINGMNVANSFVGRYFFSAIERKDWTGFSYYAWMFAGVFAVQTLIAVFFRFVEERLGSHWRNWMTRRAVERYTDAHSYYFLETSHEVTNPDQRIAEDIKALTVSTLSFLLMILNGTMTALSFSGVLWSISPTLFLVAVLYATVGSFLTIRLGKPLVRLNYAQTDFEADFRAELLRLRDNAESVALSENEPLMRDRLLQKLGRLMQNFRRIIAVNRNVSFFTTGYNYLIQLIPVVLVAPLFMHGKVEFGVIGQAAMAFAMLLGAFSIVVTQFQQISTYASVAARLGEFTEALEDAAARESTSSVGAATVADHFEFTNVTIKAATEGHPVLINELSGRFPMGKCSYVGGSGSARKALFRAVAGLQDLTSGTIVRPPHAWVTFLPEQPFLPPSDLRTLMIVSNGKVANHLTNEKIAETLREVGLAGVLDKHDGFERERDWNELLAFEERQLMAVARVILAKPTYVLGYRLESALPPQTIAKVLRLFAAHGITCILFGRSEPDAELYGCYLSIKDDASWEWQDLERLRGLPKSNPHDVIRAVL